VADYDVIIVGAGLGGLSCGALLAKNGFKTLVLEQSDIIGGCCSTFEADGDRLFRVIYGHDYAYLVDSHERLPGFILATMSQ